METGSAQGDGMRMKRRNLLAGCLVALGCSQMIGYLTGAKTVSACGAGTCFAPMAEVFSSVESDKPGERFEPFVARYFVSGLDAKGQAFEQRITPGLFAGIEGPHARRANYLNAFVGVARGNLAGEANTATEAVWCFGFGPNGPLREAFGLPEGAQALGLKVVAQVDGPGEAREKIWLLAPDCTR